jgi:hypothetical protein
LKSKRVWKIVTPTMASSISRCIVAATTTTNVSQKLALRNVRCIGNVLGTGKNVVVVAGGGGGGWNH